MFLRQNFVFNKLWKMAEGLVPAKRKSSSKVYPPVFVLSKIPELADKLGEKFASEKKNYCMPDINFKNIPVSDSSEINNDHISLFKEAEVVLCDVDLLIKSQMHMPNLKWAQSTFAGVEPLFKAFSEEPPFTITRHGGEAFCGLMAEYVVCQILNCERKLKTCWKNQESKLWIDEKHFAHRSLDQLTVAILGAGNMGTSVARFLKQRGTTVHGFARTDRPRHLSDAFDKISHDLVHIIKDCDYMCLTLPSTAVTRGILNTNILQNCQKSPVLINVGRGDLISEEDIVKSIKNSYLSGAVLDVFEKEPLPASSPLWDMPEVTITPHISAISKPEHVAEEFFKNYIKYVDSETMSNVVNWSAGY